MEEAARGVRYGAVLRRVSRKLAWRLIPGVMADRSVRWQFAHHPGAGGGWEVEDGPFAGLAYPAEVTTVSLSRLKAEGRYEAALAPILTEAVDRRPSLFVDIGGAEGYYAVGIARMGIPTVAYESSSIQRRALRRLAAANGVEVTIRRHCRRIPALPPGSLLMVDAEGSEMELLDGDAAFRLAGCTIVVELHEMFRAGVTEAVLKALGETHRGTVVKGEDEPGRGGGQPEWAVLEPLASPPLQALLRGAAS